MNKVFRLHKDTYTNTLTQRHLHKHTYTITLTQSHKYSLSSILPATGIMTEGEGEDYFLNFQTLVACVLLMRLIT